MRLKHYNLKAERFADLKNSLKVLKDADSVTTDAHHVELVGNIGTPVDADKVLENGGEGVGLYRTEFLYMDAQSLPTEEDQYVAYKSVLEKMGKKVFHTGPSGCGQVAKVCNNMLLAIHMIGTCEALSLGKNLGLDPKILIIWGRPNV